MFSKREVFDYSKTFEKRSLRIGGWFFLIEYSLIGGWFFLIESSLIGGGLLINFWLFLDLTFGQRSGLRFRLRFGLRFRQRFGLRFRLRFGLRFGLIFIHILPRKTRALLYTGLLSTEPSKRKNVVKGTVLAFVLLISLLALVHRGIFYCVNQFFFVFFLAKWRKSAKDVDFKKSVHSHTTFPDAETFTVILYIVEVVEIWRISKR